MLTASQKARLDKVVPPTKGQASRRSSFFRAAIREYAAKVKPKRRFKPKENGEGVRCYITKEQDALIRKHTRDRTVSEFLRAAIEHFAASLERSGRFLRDKELLDQRVWVSLDHYERGIVDRYDQGQGRAAFIRAAVMAKVESIEANDRVSYP